MKHSIACRSRVGDPCDCGLPFQTTLGMNIHAPSCALLVSNGAMKCNCTVIVDETKTVINNTVDIAASGLEKPPSPVGRFRATAAEVQAYRQEHQCSMFVARRNCLARNLRLAIEAAKSVDELKPVLVALLQLTDLQT